MAISPGILLEARSSGVGTRRTTEEGSEYLFRHSLNSSSPTDEEGPTNGGAAKAQDRGRGAIRSQSDPSPGSEELSDRETGKSILLFNLALSPAVGTEEAESLYMILIVPIQ
ncbi:hypothetical protein Bca52824_087144 [Brassica carinata]|uniref:Uncharacterized protein n=1 Tax=Brassica carinata TaxID=52824 RepID=A0A8X7TNC3_BRACI|nr:hypothetical protein Bca52824_087144 [Brassica carinata]